MSAELNERMKRIASVTDKDEAYSFKLRLELKGIPVHLSNEHSGPAVGAIIGADAYSLWVEIDDQFGCAVKAIEDDSYVVENPINVVEYRKAQESIEKNVRNKLSKIGEYILNSLMLIIVVIVAYRIYVAINT